MDSRAWNAVEHQSPAWQSSILTGPVGEGPREFLSPSHGGY